MIEAMKQAAARVAATPMSRVQPEGTGLLKRRRPLGALTAAASRRLPLGFEMLSGEAWFAREQALYRALHGLPVERRPDGALLLPRLPGQRLDLYVTAAHRDDALAACAAALAALEALHALDEVTPSGRLRPCSHADATARNALFDPPSGRALLFDFETMHPAHLGPLERRADDVHVLGCSLAATLGPAFFAPLARLCAASHRGSLGPSLCSLASRERTTLLRAQAPMDEPFYRRWRAELLAAIG